MNNTMKISVIVPIYNAEKYIKKTIESIQRQKNVNLEIILVDDGSTDNSYSICKKISEVDSRIILLKKENGGVATARNMGLQNSSGEYVGFVDSDDYLDADMYYKLLEALLDTNSDVSECGYYRVKSKSSLIPVELKYEILEGFEEINCSYLQKKNTTYHNWNKLYRKRIIEKVRYEKYAFSEDFLFNIHAYANCLKKVTISECLYYYNVGNIGATRGGYSIKMLDILTAGQKSYEYYLKKDKRNRTNLSPYAANYILNGCVQIFNNLRLANEKSNTRKDIIRTYKNYFKKTSLSHLFRTKYFSKKYIFYLVFFNYIPYMMPNNIRSIPK